MATTLAATLRRYCDRQLPRVLTQMDRDPASPTRGCFDRHYWHYKMRDFPSAILQQGVFALEAVRRGTLTLPGVAPASIAPWSQAAIANLARQVGNGRRVDEYYPYEDSYPAAAFGLYAATRVLRDWQTAAPGLCALDPVQWEALARLAQNLATRTEDQAANQQAAGLSGLALGLALPELHVDPTRVRALADRLLATQHAEGWFPEYGGPDFGYLSVTLDALTDYHEATGDARALPAATRAVDFMVRCVGAAGRLPGPCNSRNTDYVVPLGLARLAAHHPPANWLLHTLFRDANQPHHFLWTTDDRYHCHYVYASCVRALPYLDVLPDAPAEPACATTWLPGCGYYLHWSSDRTWSACIATRKGGLVQIQRAAADTAGTAGAHHGWRIHHPVTGRDWTSNWWSAAWEIAADTTTGEVIVSGRCQGTRQHVATPLKHAALRLLAWAFGRRLIPWLKQQLIFRQRQADGPTFTRRVQCSETGIAVQDKLGAYPGAVATISPRQNLRHVASADSFHADELASGAAAGEPHTLDQPLTPEWTWSAAAPAPESP